MTSDERVVVEIAFDGGQIMGALVTPESADSLEQALGSSIGRPFPTRVSKPRS